MSADLPETSDSETEQFLDDDGVLYDEQVTPMPGILGFTLRELLIVGVWAIAFLVSFFPLDGGASIWGSGIQWILPIGVPTVAVFLLVLRRFSPEGIRRVGSLGIDQFASVAFSVAAVIWLGSLWSAVAALIEFDVFGLAWTGVVQLVAMVGLVVLTVFAPIVPGLKDDFHGRLVTLAHRNANPARPVIARPRPDAQSAAVAGLTPEQPGADAVATAGALRISDEPPTSAASLSDADRADPATSAQQVTTEYGRRGELDVEFAHEQATDEIARFDVADQVPLAAHASGGGTGTESTTSDEEYVPTYSRRSRGPEIVSDTGSIEALLQTAHDVESPDTVADPSIVAHSVTTDHSPGEYSAAESSTPVFEDRQRADGRFSDDRIDQDEESEVEATHPRDTAQPFWILAQTERDVHDERGEPLFRIGPAAWALVIEDRGGAYVVRHDDGRIGYLHDISDISKG